MVHLRRYTLLSSALVLLAGCSGVADTLGLGARNAPDEYAVVERPPLAMPPDYNLRPPRPGAPRPQETHATERAGQTVFGSASSQEAPTAASDSERLLLEKAGTAQAQTGIRETIDREAAQKVSGSERLIDNILWWREKEAKAATVDAEAEKKRIEEAEKKGQSINSGATPVIEKGSNGWLGL